MGKSVSTTKDSTRYSEHPSASKEWFGEKKKRNGEKCFYHRGPYKILGTSRRKSSPHNANVLPEVWGNLLHLHRGGEQPRGVALQRLYRLLGPREQPQHQALHFWLQHTHHVAVQNVKIHEDTWCSSTHKQGLQVLNNAQCVILSITYLHNTHYTEQDVCLELK